MRPIRPKDICVGMTLKLSSWGNVQHVVRKIEGNRIYWEGYSDCIFNPLNNEWYLVIHPCSSNCKCSYVEDKPVMCACAAKEILEAQGYTVTPPPEPVKGKAVVFRFQNEIVCVNKTSWDCRSQNMKRDREVLAIVDWTEGQGLETEEEFKHRWANDMRDGF